MGVLDGAPRAPREKAVSGFFAHWFEWAEWRILAQKCIRLVREKLTVRVFSYVQYIVGMYVSLDFRRYSQVSDRC